MDVPPLMAAYSDVRAWQPGPLVDAEERLRVASESVTGVTDEWNSTATPPAWHGAAAEAALSERGRVADGMEHLVAGIEAVRAACLVASLGVKGLNGLVSAAEELARTSGFAINERGLVSDVGSTVGEPGGLYRAAVSVAGFPGAAEFAAQREGTRARLVAMMRQILTRAHEVDSSLTEVLGKAERGEITDGGATNLADAAVAGAAQGVRKPPLPGPRPNLPIDGAGEHGSQPWYSRMDDYLVAALVSDGANLADLIGWDRTAKLLRHYLGNSGRDVTVNAEDMMRDLPGLRSAVEKTTVDQLRKLAEEAATNGTYGQPVQFASEWRRDDLIDEADRDWFYAIGTVDYSISGVATVYPPDHPGGAPRIEMDYRTHFYDRYNFDQGATTETTIELPVDRIAALHRAGLAREFNTIGTSDVKHYAGPVL